MTISAYIELLRPHQWIKNVMLLFPPFLGGELLKMHHMTIFLSFFSLSAAASSIYIINDICDQKFDAEHPTKKLRPLPSGEVKISTAFIFAVTLLFISLFIGSALSISFVLILFAYISISLAYSLRLKDFPVIELFCVVSGFLLRLIAGGYAFDIIISHWLFLSVFLLALFLVSGKRLGELKHEGGSSPEAVRPVLALYPRGFLEGGMFISGAAVLVTYTMYVLSHPILVYTVPLCCFGLLAYLLRVLSGRGGDPTRALLNDPVLLLVSTIWGSLVGINIYWIG